MRTAGGIHVAEQPKHKQLSNWIREHILSGEFPNETKLLSENELAKRFDISRQTVRQSIATLVNEGLLIRRRGSGTYISYHPKPPRKKSHNIAVITTYLDSYVFPDIIHGIEQVLTKAGYQIQFGITYNRIKNEGNVLSSMLSGDVDGFIIEPTKSAFPNPNIKLYQSILEQDIPVIFLNGYYSNLEIPHVVMDDYAAGRMATQYLIDQGHERLFGIFKSDDIQGHYRYSGFVNSVQDAGLSYDDSDVLWYVTEDLKQIFSSDNDHYFLERLQGHSGVVCYNDEVACMLGELLRRNGKKIPDDVSVISFDNSQLATFGGFSLCSMEFPFKEIGRTAAQQMVDCLEHGKTMRGYVFTPKLIKRDSVKSFKK